MYMQYVTEYDVTNTTTEKYDNNGKVLYFRFDDDNMSYTYILSIIWTAKKTENKKTEWNKTDIQIYAKQWHWFDQK